MSLEYLETQLLESLSPDSRRIARKLLGLLEEEPESHPRSSFEGLVVPIRPCLGRDSFESFPAEVHRRHEDNPRRQTQKNPAPKEKTRIVEITVRKEHSKNKLIGTKQKRPKCTQKRLESKERCPEWNGVLIRLLR